MVRGSIPACTWRVAVRVEVDVTVVRPSYGSLWSGVDIRTKLIFALVAVSLGSMFVLGAVVSPRVEGYIRDGTLQRLEALAEAKRESLHWIIAGWRDATGLVASRSQLRASLDEQNRTGSASARERMRTILADAIASSRGAVLLDVHGADGRSVASAQRERALLPVAADSIAPRPAGEAIYAGVRLVDSGPPQVTFLAPLVFEGQSIGTLVAAFAAPELLALTGDPRALGDTGETLILAEDGMGGLRTLHPTRHGSAGRASVSVPSQPGSLGAHALGGEADPLMGGVTDYRGEEVWAATRRVDETGWGLVVKLDRAEARQTALEFNVWLRQTALILSAFTIVLGLVLALRFALPIHALAEVANRIRKGEMHARANAAREDEVGLLARTFNEMADELEQRLLELHQFRKLFDVSIDLMCMAGTDGFFKRVNPAFERVLGWSESELLERPFFDFVHPDDLARTEQEVARLAEGIPTISFENRFERKDGGYKRLRWTSYPADGVLYAVAHVLDGPRAP